MRRDRVELAAAGFAFALGLVLLLTGSGGAYVAQVVVWVSINIILACSLRVMLLVGEVNLAVGGFFGVGAYVAAVAFLTLGLPMLVGIALGALVAGLFSLPFGYVTLRTSGHYFMLISFALTEVLRLIYTKSMLLGGNSGLVGMYPDIKGYPLLVLALAVAIFLGFYFLDRSHLGRVFSAVAQNEKVVRSVGIHVSRVKLLCLVISSCAAGSREGCSRSPTLLSPPVISASCSPSTRSLTSRLAANRTPPEASSGPSCSLLWRNWRSSTGHRTC